ncbi:NADPH-dependent FMN reductase [Adhaeribacter rhizoryzae]|uniref:NAD(P)H-dependent oxidoreductase n=1 Tax=Adhaeribacter rhizoryzae TaxID=2607907 RepID=A0A5M6D7R6_9BACT|nr:NAD(P)H-dependent oxidoreductase [Adhaeribacter rhizoryzae]KAA5541215.1 NAD(P)H-dependent oxidoreductase [Adhaeribacter rhizoryzae]
MPHLAIIAASVRTANNTKRVALFFQNYIQAQQLGTTDLLDLQAFGFPIFEERLSFQENPSAQVLDFAARIRKADGVLICTPEYNGGYPASLKNVIDLLYEEWHRKPIAIATVSDGNFGGTQVITSLLFTLYKIRAWVVPAMFPVPSAQNNFDAAGKPLNPQQAERRAKIFTDEWLWCIEANKRMATT